MHELVKDFRNVYEIVLRKKFGHKGDKVIGEGRRLHNEELYALCFTAHTSQVLRPRTMRLVGYVTGIADRRGVYRVLV